MKITIQYESETLLPKELVDEFDLMRKRIMENKYEPDKIFLNISTMKSKIIKWIADNRTEVVG